MVHFWLTCSLSKHSTTSDNSRSEYKWCVLVWRLFVFYNHLHHSNISCDIAYVKKTLFTLRKDTPGECKKFIAEIILVIKNFIRWSLQLVLMSWKTNISLSFLFFCCCYVVLFCTFYCHLTWKHRLKKNSPAFPFTAPQVTTPGATSSGTFNKNIHFFSFISFF